MTDPIAALMHAYAELIPAAGWAVICHQEDAPEIRRIITEHGTGSDIRVIESPHVDPGTAYQVNSAMLDGFVNQPYRSPASWAALR